MLRFWKLPLVPLAISMMFLTANGAESFVVLESFDEYQTGEFKSQGDWEVLNGDVLIASTPNASDKSLEIKSKGGYAKVYRLFEPQEDLFCVEYDVMYAAGPIDSCVPYIGNDAAVDGGGENWGAWSVCIAGSSGNITYWPGWEILLGGIETDKWYHIKLEMDVPKNLHTLYAAEADAVLDEVAKDQAFRAGVDSLSVLFFIGADNFLINNLAVYQGNLRPPEAVAPDGKLVAKWSQIKEY